MNIYIFKKSDDSVEDLILHNQDVFIYIPISIDCPFYIVKTKMEQNEVRSFFHNNHPLFFNSKIIDENYLQIEEWGDEIKKTLDENRVLNAKSSDDIDGILYLISEFGFDFLNFEQKEVIQEYSKTV